MQVLQIINPSVSNADRSDYFVAMVLDDVLSKISSTFGKEVIEKSVKASGYGCGSNTSDSRYFLRKGCSATTLSLPKQKLHKRHCCIINTTLVDEETLLTLEKCTESRVLISFTMHQIYDVVQYFNIQLFQSLMVVEAETLKLV